MLFIIQIQEIDTNMKSIGNLSQCLSVHVNLELVRFKLLVAVIALYYYLSVT